MQRAGTFAPHPPTRGTPCVAPFAFRVHATPNREALNRTCSPNLNPNSAPERDLPRLNGRSGPCSGVDWQQEANRARARARADHPLQSSCATFGRDAWITTFRPCSFRCFLLLLSFPFPSLFLNFQHFPRSQISSATTKTIYAPSTPNLAKLKTHKLNKHPALENARRHLPPR